MTMVAGPRPIKREGLEINLDMGNPRYFPVRTNLMVDGSAEANPSQWASSMGATLAQKPGLKSTKCMRTTQATSHLGVYTPGKGSNFVNGEIYYLSFWIRGSEATGRQFRVALGGIGDGGKGTKLGPFVYTDKWTYFEFPFIRITGMDISTNNYQKIRFYDYTNPGVGEWMEVDEVKLYDVSKTAPHVKTQGAMLSISGDNVQHTTKYGGGLVLNDVATSEYDTITTSGYDYDTVMQTNYWSVEMVVRQTRYGAYHYDTNRSIAANLWYGAGNGYYDGVRIVLTPAGPQYAAITSPPVVQLTFGNATPVEKTVSLQSPSSIDSPLHIIVSVDGTNIRMLVNGSYTETTWSGNYTSGANGPGLRFDQVSGIGSFVGEFYLYRFYSKGLTESEMRHNFNAVKAKYQIT